MLNEPKMLSKDPIAHTTAYLLDQVRAGDIQAKVQLIARVDPLLRRFARGRVPQLLRHQQDTADLIQNTWLRVLERLPEIQTQEKGAFFAYLRAALVNALREALRRQQRQSNVLVSNEHLSGEAANASTLDVPARHVDPDDWLSWEQALQVMDPELRGLVLMRFEFGMSFQEIAGELADTPDAVRMKLSRALTKMAANPN
jgi:RNA polymerase sigma factor (sigma-70 family)